MDNLAGLGITEADAIVWGQNLTTVLAVASFMAQSEAANEVWDVLIGMLRDYRARVHHRGMAGIEAPCEPVEGDHKKGQPNGRGTAAEGPAEGPTVVDTSHQHYPD